MSDNAKIMVPYTKWAKWTGDNLEELSTFWADELSAMGSELSEDQNGCLVGSNGFFTPWATPVPPGMWTAPSHAAGTTEEQLFAIYAEMPPA